ncbi:TetR family transcriptional regulator [Actinophytocola sp.]|uniref:TetR/AcrR family transcriptional regulator n=1 Tax=Actinophytocola sp. TaxID=1872138 RepID=UPI002D7E5231|nr:TetR family transcriptional regulator [Actinophytocola sp.]HET9138948.1 TetR family transcriptional regulator [Actinophytocola sp.]HEU5107856.1 TetR family transcriptional regulator [Micromonosporaceae bacterium]
MTDTVDQTEGRPSRRRGRRPGGTDTRTALLDAARQVFSEQGYDGATVRAIATRAGVDAAMVNHWFGSKEGLFVKAVLQLPFDPADLFTRLAEGPADALGERIVRTFVTTWDATGGGHFTALVRSVSSHEQAAHLLNDFFVKEVFTRIANQAAPDQAHFRGSLVGSQIVGLGMARYVVRFEPLASADVEQVVAAVAPNVQRYLTGNLG